MPLSPVRAPEALTIFGDSYIVPNIHLIPDAIATMVQTNDEPKTAMTVDLALSQSFVRGLFFHLRVNTHHKDDVKSPLSERFALFQNMTKLAFRERTL